RQLSPLRLAVATLLRLALLLALTLALAGLTRKEAVDDLGVVFVIDRSASVGEGGARRAGDFVRAALASQGEDDVAGVVVFGADALVETQAREELVFDGVESGPVPHQTDISGGLRLATALLPADRARRIVLLSDGEETRGDAATQVLLTAGDDLEI